MTSDIFKNKYNSLGIKIVQTILCYIALLGILNRKVKNRDITSLAAEPFFLPHILHLMLSSEVIIFHIKINTDRSCKEQIVVALRCIFMVLYRMLYNCRFIPCNL